MKKLFLIPGFISYIVIVFLNAVTDLGHKIILQNTIFKVYEGSELMILTAIVNALILLPFIFLFSPAGFISDRYNKLKVIEYASLAAVGITLLITLSYYLGWFWVAFGFTFVLAAQSAIYSPAKYGIIKEMVGEDGLAEANGLVQAIVVVAILAGALIYSIFFEGMLSGGETTTKEYLQSIAPLGFVLVISSIIEYAFAKHLAKNAKLLEDASLHFDIKKYSKLEYLRENLKLIKSKEAIWLSIIGLSIIWGISQVVVAVFGEFLKDSLGITNTVTAQGLLALSGVGIIFGSLFAGRMSRHYIETGLIPIGALGVALSLYMLPTLNSVTSLGIDLFAFGFFAGLFIVPLNSLIQFATPTKNLGMVLSGNNFMQNVVMFVALIITAIFAYLNISSTLIFVGVATIAMLGMGYTFIKLPQSLVRYAVRVLIRVRYKIFVEGIDNVAIEDKGVLLLGNHISFLDWAMLQIAYPKQIRFVMDRVYYDKWYLKPFFKFFKVIPISNRGSKSALKEVTKALKNGDSVAIFPEGYITKNGHLGEFKRGFEVACKELEESDALIVPFYLRGLWEDIFSYASNKLQNSGQKDVSVTFGKPMSIKSSATEVKRAVFELSIKAWQNYSKRLKPIQKAWIKRAKEVGGALSVADSTGAELSGYKFITATLLIANKLKPKIPEQNIGIIMPSTAGGALVNMAVLSLGKTVVNLNYSASIPSLLHAIDVAEVKTIITAKQFIARLKAKGFDIGEILDRVQVIYMEDVKESLSKIKSIGYFLAAKFLPTWVLSGLFIKDNKITDTAAILFSSGSEGTPKGIELTHQNIMGNIKQFVGVINPKDDDSILATLPIFHSFGLTVTTFMPLIEGLPMIAHPDPTDGYGIGKMAAKYRATIMCGTATFYRLYTRNRKLKPIMFESLRYVVAGAEKLPSDVREAFKKRFNKDILEGYGTTETTPVASTNMPDVLREDFSVQIGNKPGTVGLPIPGSCFRIVDPDTFKELPIGKDGMILIGGTQIMKGYVKDEKKTKEVIKEIDGIRWYVTGDKGHLDEDGFLTIVDRYSRFAKIGGEMVSLGLVERELNKLIDEESFLAVTAIPDSKKGEKLVCLIEGKIEIDELKEKIKSLNLNPLFIPSIYHKVDEVPKLGSGKLDLKGLKKMALEICG